MRAAGLSPPLRRSGSRSGPIARLVARAIDDAARPGLGLWILDGPGAPHAGCVQLQPEDTHPRAATLAYLLDPAHWGRGLATRMGWTAITWAFQAGIDVIVAGTDAPNAASLAVMRRLGMRFRRHVTFPLGAGVEYELRRSDPGPEPRPGSMRMS